MQIFDALLSYGAIGLLTLSLLLASLAIIHFENVLVKLVIFEVLLNLFVAGVSLWALETKQIIYIDICLPVALIAFLSVVAFYQYLAKEEELHG